MSFREKRIEEFLDALASKAPVPGGGGASALLSAIGAALGQMVCNLTVGKKKYAAVEPDILALREKLEVMMHEFEQMMDEDAVAFEPLSKAYGLPRDTQEQIEERAKIMEAALKTACSVPLKIMERTSEALDLLAELAKKGSALAISDVGVAAVAAKAALQGASLNVYINTDLMADKAAAAAYESAADSMMAKYNKVADDIFTLVINRVRKVD